MCWHIKMHYYYYHYCYSCCFCCYYPPITLTYTFFLQQFYNTEESWRPSWLFYLLFFLVSQIFRNNRTPTSNTNWAHQWIHCLYFNRLPCQSYMAKPAHTQCGRSEKCILGLRCQGNPHHRGSFADDQAVWTRTWNQVSDTCSEDWECVWRQRIDFFPKYKCITSVKFKDKHTTSYQRLYGMQQAHL